MTALREKAVRVTGAGRPAEALGVFDSALALVRSLPDGQNRRQAEAWTLISRADPVLEVEGLQPALDSLAEAVATGGNIEIVAALAHSQRAMLLGRSGDIDGAESELRAAIGLRTALPAYNQWVLMINRGMLRMQRGDLTGARGDLILARDIAADNGLSVPAFKATHNLAYVEFLAGDLSRAIRLMRQAGSGSDAPDEVRLVATQDQARILMECGLFDDADAALMRAAQLAARLHSGQTGAEVALDRARLALARDDLPAARRHARRARASFARRGQDRRVAESDLLLVEAALAAGRGLGPAVARAEAVLTGQPDARTGVARRAALLAAEGRFRTGQVDPAEQMFARARRPVRTLTTSERLHANLVGAQLAADRDGPAAARRVLRRAVTELAAAQTRLSSLDLRTGVAVHGRRLADFDLELALRSGRPRELLTAVERWRAVSDRIPPVGVDPDPEAAELLVRLRMLHAELSDAREADDRQRIRTRIAGIEGELRHLGWGAEGTDGGSRAGHGAGTGAGLGEVADVLRAHDATLIAFAVHRDRVIGIAGLGSPGGRLRWAELGPLAGFAETVARIRADLRALSGRPANAALAAAVHASLVSGLRRVDELMLAPLGVGDERLVVVAGRAMAALPWAMLPRRGGAPTTVAGSMAAWAQRSAPVAGAAGRPAAPAVSAIAGPGLAHADREVRTVARLWRRAGTSRSVGSGRSRATGLVEALEQDRIVHVAAHGRHNAQSPLFSSLRLADGVVFAHELQHQGVGAEHVVLSACDVGESTVRPGEEALGLTAALLAMGTRCVVAPVTAVPDDLACQVMTDYHRALVSGTPASEALARAARGRELAGAFCAFGGEWRL